MFCGRWEGTFSTSVPFIHIPKTGGTSIEDTLAAIGIYAGRQAFKNNVVPPYLTVSVPCSKWHRPPKSFVKGSFCVLRDPYVRLVSEYNYERKNRKFGFSHTGCTCAEFDDWIRRMYTEVRSNTWTRDCHFLSQTEYTSKCETVLLYHRDVNAYIDEKYNIKRGERVIANVAEHCLHDHQEDAMCKQTAQFIYEWYQNDHELFKNMTDI